MVRNLLQVSAHYVRPNISRNARDRTSAFFKVLSVLAEIFVFIYIGTSISMNTDAWRNLKTWTMLVRSLYIGEPITRVSARRAGQPLGVSPTDGTPRSRLEAKSPDHNGVNLQGVALVALALSRAANVWPCTSLVNYFRPPELRIPRGQQLMIWFSGMRGAMAFAMALRALDELSRAFENVFLQELSHEL